MSTQFKYTLRTGSKKDFCPACHKKTFVPYVETESGNEIPNAGRCDREQHCGFFQKPESNEPIFAPKFEEVEKKTDYIPLEELERYYLNPSIDSFCKFLSTKFNEGQVKKAKSDYLLSTKGEAVIFWQIDQLERVRSGKIMEYNPTTGKRIKDENGKSHINWTHKQPFNLKQCLFGLHLSKESINKPIAIVESEKTAVIMSIKEPRLIWMACGSLGGFKIDMLAPIRLRQIVAFPDKGCFEKWQEVALKLNESGFLITVNEDLENNTNANLGDDIADIYL